MFLYESTITKPPKEKFIVLVYVGPTEADRPLLFFINSNIHPFIRKRPELNCQQLQISPQEKGHGSLSQDSYIACHETKIELSVLELNTFGQKKGSLSKRAIEELCNIVSNSSTISAGEQKLILSAFGKH